jgi:hypothetical protein
MIDSARQKSLVYRHSPYGTPLATFADVTSFDP